MMPVSQSNSRASLWACCGTCIVELQGVLHPAKGPEPAAEQRYAAGRFVPDGAPLDHGGGRMSRHPVRQ